MITIADAADENLAIPATWATRHLPGARVDDAADLVLLPVVALVLHAPLDAEATSLGQ